MLTSLLWLSPTVAEDSLKTVSDALCGELPCPGTEAAKKVRALAPEKCRGVLCDDSLRQDLALTLEGFGEVTSASGVALMEKFSLALAKRVGAVKAKAKDKKVAGEGFGLKLPAGETAGDALQSDWLRWHAVGHAFDKKQLPAPAESLVNDRLALAQAVGSGPLVETLLALHVLENADAYIKWEASLPGSQAKANGREVLQSFDSKMAKEVAIRRTLTNGGLTMAAATAASQKVAGGAALPAVLKELANEAKAVTLIPLYVAPPAPKAPKEKGETAEKGEKQEKGGKKEKGDAAAPAPAAKAAAAPAKAPTSAFGKLHGVTATQELQWALLQYQMRPGTTLGKAAVSTMKPGAAAKGPAAAGGGAVASRTADAPKGFAGIWAPLSAAPLPPGHTPYSWEHAQAKGMKDGFQTTWEPVAGNLPPGHTNYSWEKAMAAGGAASATPSSSTQAKAPAAAAGKAAVKPAAKPAGAKAAAAPAGGSAPAEGSPEAALCKLDIRCGCIKECGRVPDADSLYLLKVDVGEEQPRQVVSSLVAHYKEEELRDRQVMVYCNIKPGKMRGYDSEAMILAATKDKGEKHEKCELLSPPLGTPEGAHPMCGNVEVGSLSAGVNVKNISKVWGQVQPLLLTDAKGAAAFNGTAWSLPGGAVTVPSLTGMSIS